jgi:hypothetical protein
MMARSFWVVMQKRDDGKVYADLHKTDERIYQTLEEAEEALVKKPLTSCFQVVEMVAETLEEWKQEAPDKEASEHTIDPREALLRAALYSAFSLGQRYWQLADSDSQSNWRRADEVKQKLETVVQHAVDSIIT